MTKLIKQESKEQLKELLIKNLPYKIKGGNDKHTSNVLEYKTHIALDKCKFINFNTKEQISFLVFDIDKFADKTALEHFKTIDGLFDYIADKIGLEPTYILQTTKGFHFAYHLKNHIFTKNQKALTYLLDIKQAITKLLGCDEIASHRLSGVWRNPILHPHYYSLQINYELKDFNFLLQRKESRAIIKTQNKIDESSFIAGQRNHSLFKYAMRYAKAQSTTSIDDIFSYLVTINTNYNVNLPQNELYAISKSVFKYWLNNAITYGTTTQKNINEGIMQFPKMKNLSQNEYEQETKQRQQYSAYRTLQIRDKATNSISLQQARVVKIDKQKIQIQELISKAIDELEQEGKKINASQIAKLTNLDRRTVSKYMN